MDEARPKGPFIFLTFETKKSVKLDSAEKESVVMNALLILRFFSGCLIRSNYHYVRNA